MFIESMGMLSTPVVVKGMATSLPAAKAALTAKYAGVTAPKVWLAVQKAVASGGRAVIVVLPQAKGYGAHAARSIVVLPQTALVPAGNRAIDVANGFYHTLKDGSLSLSEMGSMADTAAQGSQFPLQGTVATVQNIATSVQNVLAPLAAGVLGGGATHIGLHRRQNKRTRGKLGELLAAVTEQRQEITSLRDQISTAVARIDQIEEVLAAQPVPPTAAPSSGDALEAIKGIGPVFARRLREAGILTFSDLTKLSAEEIQAIVAPGRASHMFDIEDWIMQARQYAEESGQEPAGEA